MPTDDFAARNGGQDPQQAETSRPVLRGLTGGCSVGYHRAGFDVVGVDHAPQPRYPFRFVLADALEYLAGHGREFDAVHASPPCQAYSRATACRGDRSAHPDLIDRVRALLVASGRPSAIENVQEARHLLRSRLMLCGTAFGRRVRRQRWFELSVPVGELVRPCQHRRSDCCFDHGAKQTEAAYRGAMGCEWMTVHEAR